MRVKWSNSETRWIIGLKKWTNMLRLLGLRVSLWKKGCANEDWGKARMNPKMINWNWRNGCNSVIPKIGVLCVYRCMSVYIYLHMCFICSVCLEAICLSCNEHLALKILISNTITPTKGNQGSLWKLQLAGMGQSNQRFNLRHLVLLKSREVLKKKKKRKMMAGMPQAHRSQLKAVPAGQNWNNLSTKKRTLMIYESLRAGKREFMNPYDIK